MKKNIIIIIILIYFFSAYLWPGIFFRSGLFIIFTLLVSVIFFLKLSRLNKIVMVVIALTFGLFIFNILPSPIALLIGISLSIPLAIFVGIIIILILLLIEVKLLFYFFNYFKK